MHKIAILSDIHGNMTALEAVLEDAMQEKVTEYWILGDLFMIGPGSSDLIKRLRDLPNVIFIRGNWDDVFLNAATSDFTDPTNVYGSRLAKYHYEQLSKEDLTFIKELPSVAIKKVAGLEFFLIKATVMSYGQPKNKKISTHYLPIIIVILLFMDICIASLCDIAVKAD